MSFQYEQNLWNKIDLLHERYTRHHTYMIHLIEVLSKYHQACFEFSKTIKNILSKNYSMYDDTPSTFNNSMKSFIKTLSTHSQLFLQTSENIKTVITEPMLKSLNEHSQKEKDTYNTYSKSRYLYNNLKSSLDKIHKEFEQRAKESESLVYNSKKSKFYNLVNQEQLTKMEAKATEALTNTSICEEKYMNTLNETNKARENETLLQKKSHNFYETSDTYHYNQIKSLIGFFITSLKQMQTTINIEIIDLTDKFNRLNLNNDIKEFIDENKSDEKPDVNIEFIPYIPCPELTKRTNMNVKGEEMKDFDINYEVVNAFQKYLKNIRTDLNLDEEKKKNIMRNLIDHLLKTEDNSFNIFSKKDLEELLNKLQDPFMKSYFLLYISKVKSKGLIKSENLFLNLKEIFFFILKVSEENQDFDTTQNCISLCQTLYIENKLTKSKKYLIDYMLDYNWLNTMEFWEGIIEYKIEKEILKNEEINKDKDEKQLKSNAKNIVFSQVFSYSNNMVQFNINKEDIIAMVEKYCREFEIDNSMLNSIVENINNAVNNKILRKQKEKEEEEKIKKLEEENKKKNEGQPEKVDIIKDYFSPDK